MQVDTHVSSNGRGGGGGGTTRRSVMEGVTLGCHINTTFIIMNDTPKISDTRSWLPITGSLTRVKALQQSHHSSVGRASVLSHVVRQ